MKDDEKSREELLDELARLRLRLAGLEKRGDAALSDPCMEQYRLLLDNADDVIWLWDLDEGRYLYISPSVERLYGFSAHQLLEMSLGDVLPDEYQWLINEGLPLRINALQSGDETLRIKSNEVDLKRGDGALVPAEIVTTLISDSSGHVRYVHGITRNITERRKAELLFRESEEKYRIIADFASGLEMWQAPDRRFLYISPSSETLTGYSAPELIAKPQLFMDMAHPDDVELFRRHIREFHGASPAPASHIEYRIVRRDGSVVWIDHQCQPVFYSDGTYGGRRSSDSDITARKTGEERLRTSEGRLMAILEAIDESIFLLDTEARVLMSNSITARRLGTDIEKLKRGTVFDHTPPEVRARRLALMKKVIEAGDSLQFEDERLGRNMQVTYYPVREDGRVSHVVVFAKDITEEKRAQRALESSRVQLAKANSMLNLVIDTIPVRIFWKDSNLRYLGCNRLFAADAGWEDPSELTGKNDFDMAWKKEAEAYRKDDLEVMLLDRAKLNYEEPQTTPEGSLIWLRTFKVPLKDAGGNVMGILGTYEDITERKKAEEDRERLIVELRDAFSKIKTLSGMFPICAHCKKIRDDRGYWNQIESYIRDHSEAEFTHGICPDCLKKLYPEMTGMDDTEPEA
jgi:PAS domain S-box-containing protein